MSTLDQRAIEFASAKCQCETCPVGHDKFDLEQQEVTCDKFNRYVRLYKEIAEPYQQRIEELESQNMSLRDDLDLARL